MELNGRELHFAYTVGAKREADNLIAAHGGQNLNDLLGGSLEAQEAGTCGMILILSCIPAFLVLFTQLAGRLLPSILIGIALYYVFLRKRDRGE